jgi:putative membrane-bound dehydrogenase-like protein
VKRTLCCSTFALLVAWTVLPARPADSPSANLPQVADSRLRIDLFAAAPDIAHPISMDFDNRGRLLVIESHTHFRPDNYKGPRHDRLRILEDTDGDGKADRFTTFFEGTQATMDVAVHPDTSVYLATRNEILRLRDTDGDGKADEQRRIVFLDTKGNYPHNGISGLCFDSRGDLYFGLGENLGADYKLTGTDGTTLTGGGEGGNVYWCTSDGRGLRRVATGFWNPFGICRDIFGRLFAVDNDPDAMPPCRMVHVVEGGDYGYQFRYGRSGRHPFQSWDGQLPGTLPMVTGVGEAPCEIVSYESDGLPREYIGNLLVASWADHRVERYEVKERGASYSAQRKPFVQGGKDFRPVGIAVAPDGSLFVSDWVRREYALHGQGSIWHIRQREAAKPDRPTDLRRALSSPHRPLRESAARKLAADEQGRALLRQQLANSDVRARAVALTALIDAADRNLPLQAIADKDAATGLRALAVRALVARGEDTTRFVADSYPPAVRLEATAGLRGETAVAELRKLLADPDPFLRSAAVHQLSRSPALLAGNDLGKPTIPLERIGILLAWRVSGKPEAAERVRAFLNDPDEDVRFLAVKWVADQKLEQYRPLLTEALKDRRLNVRLYFAYSAALARLDDRDVSEAKMADYFFNRLTDPESPAGLRVLALQMLPITYPKLKLDLLARLLARDEPALQLEAVRSLSEHPSRDRFRILLAAARNSHLDDKVRSQAILGLSTQSPEPLEDLFSFVRGEDAVLRDEALRALVGTKLNPTQRDVLSEIERKHPGIEALAARVRGEGFVKDRPPATDIGAWLARLEGPADPAAGRRVFFHPKVAGCFRCHRVEGRGQEVGPDLSTIGRTDRRHILESILQPSNLVAPHYQAWRIETANGKVYTGMLVKTVLDEYTYLDAQGNLFKLNTRDITESQPLPTSIMPDGLVNQLTDQEVRDLLAYLGSRR